MVQRIEFWKYAKSALVMASRGWCRFIAKRVETDIGLIGLAFIGALYPGVRRMFEVELPGLVYGIAIIVAYLVVVFAVQLMRAPAKKHAELQGRIKRQGNRIAELETALTPKLKLSCGKDVDGTHKYTPIQIKRAGALRGSKELPAMRRSLRLAITTDCPGGVSGCTGVITEVRNEAQTKMIGENIDLPFTLPTGDNPLTTDVRPGVVAYLEVLLIPESGSIELPMGARCPNSVAFDFIFNQTREYVIEIVVAGSGTVSSKAILKFNPTGDWRTAEMSLMPSTPET